MGMKPYGILSSEEMITFVFCSIAPALRFEDQPFHLFFGNILCMYSGISNTIIEKLIQYPGVELKPHFDKLSLRWKKRIWITWKLGESLICLKLSLEDQEVFTRMSKGAVYPVPNKWGGHGWTNVDCQGVGQALFSDILLQSMILLDAKTDHSSLISFLHQIYES